MKRILSIMLTFAMVLMFTGVFSSCKNEKVLVIGYTEYEPMNYLENGELVGFDTEFAKAVAEKLGMKAEFQVIQWGSKYMELDSGNIDVVWNGFTSNSTEENGDKRSDLVDFSHAYMYNNQAVVIRTADESTINSKAALAGKKYSAENGSSGEAAAKTLSNSENYIGKNTQSATLLELKSGQVDFVVIDWTMANSLVGNGDYSDLKILNIEIDFEVEKYAIGFKKGNTELLNKINKAIKELAEDGTLAALAEKYGLSNNVILSY